MNEHEYGDSSTNIMGRRIDLLAISKMYEDKNTEVTVELGSVEIKPEGLDNDVVDIQLNKNAWGRYRMHNYVFRLDDNFSLVIITHRCSFTTQFLGNRGNFLNSPRIVGGLS
jgi:hypothetical protein